MRKPLFVVLFLLTTLTGFSQVIDKPVATVSLTKREVITQKQLKAQIANLDKSLTTPIPKEKRKDILDAMVNALLVVQAAERDGIKVSDVEVTTYINQQFRAPLERSLGKPMADADFRKYIADQGGISWDAFVKQIRDNALQQRYIADKKKDVLGKIAMPTEREIETIFEENSMQYTNPDIVKFSQLFIDTRTMNSETRDRMRKEVDALYKEVQNGKMSFNDMLVKYAEAPKTNYQVDFTAYLARNDVQKMTLLGSTFYQTIFTMKPGEVRGILDSKVGIHIVRLVEKIPKKFLTLDDKILPDKDITVREYIRQQKALENQQTVLQQATADVVAELRKKAEIKVIEENLNW